jgi:hypothetical protein
MGREAQFRLHSGAQIKGRTARRGSWDTGARGEDDFLFRRIAFQDSTRVVGRTTQRGTQAWRGTQGESVPHRRDRLPDGWEQGSERERGT